nr:THAP domain-containing protein 6-like [Rhipicephalus microplus]
MPACCAVNCTSRPEKSSGKTFHLFPRSKPDLYRRWVVNLRRDKWTPSPGSSLCSDHFTDNCFDRTGARTRLQPDAVPTLFSFPKHLEKRTAERKPPKQRTAIVDVTPVEQPNDNTPTTVQENSAHVAEHSYAVLDTPKTLKRKLDACTDSAATVKRKLKLSLERERRLRRKVSSFNEIIDDLKHKQLISEDASAMLERCFMGIPLEVTKRLLKQTSSEGDKSSVKLSRDKYFPALRAFALTLQFYSTKAYNYVRETFQCSLPHPSTITKWYSSINGEPGFTSEAINAIRAKASEAKKNNKQLLCNLVVDEMAIRKHLE